MVKPHSSNFRVITTNVLGVRKLKIITVMCQKDSGRMANSVDSDQTSQSDLGLHCFQDLAVRILKVFTVIYRL